MPVIGWFGEDVWNAAKAAASGAFSVIPGSDAIAGAMTDVWTGPLRDFAKTPLGVTVLTAVASAAYGPLAYALGGPYGLASFGAQLATVTWALPGLARGDDFATAWMNEVKSRAERTAEIVGGDAATELVAQLGTATDFLKSLAPDEIQTLENAPADVLADSVHTLASEAGVDDWSLAMAASALFDWAPKPPNWGGVFVFDDNGALWNPVGWVQDFKGAGAQQATELAPIEMVNVDQVFQPAWSKGLTDLVPNIVSSHDEAGSTAPSGAPAFGVSSNDSASQKRNQDVLLGVVIVGAVLTFMWWKQHV